MEVVIKLPGSQSGYLTVDAPSLEVARLVSACCGFYDVDVEPQGPGRVSVTAYADKRTLTCNGTTIYDACDSLITILANEPK